MCCNRQFKTYMGYQRHISLMHRTLEERKQHKRQYDRMWQKKWEQANPDAARKNYLLWSRQHKLKVIEAYGGKCCQCGENISDFLELDHVNGGGQKDKRLAYLYTALVQKNNYKHPEGLPLQLLCSNCNHLKRNTYNIKNSSVFIMKQQVYEHYGNQCVCCKQNDVRVLTLDHVNNDGFRDKRPAINIYSYLLKHNFQYPFELQLLCWNCNVGKHRNKGICPHKNSEKVILSQ